MNTIGMIPCVHACYPPWLVTRKGSGPDLWYAGNLELLGQAAVAVTGVREPDDEVAERAVTLGGRSPGRGTVLYPAAPAVWIPSQCAQPGRRADGSSAARRVP